MFPLAKTELRGGRPALREKAKRKKGYSTGFRKLDRATTNKGRVRGQPPHPDGQLWSKTGQQKEGEKKKKKVWRDDTREVGPYSMARKLGLRKLKAKVRSFKRKNGQSGKRKRKEK